MFISLSSFLPLPLLDLPPLDMIFLELLSHSEEIVEYVPVQTFRCRTVNQSPSSRVSRDHLPRGSAHWVPPVPFRKGRGIRSRANLSAASRCRTFDQSPLSRGWRENLPLGSALWVFTVLPCVPLSVQLLLPAPSPRRTEETPSSLGGSRHSVLLLLSVHAGA